MNPFLFIQFPQWLNPVIIPGLPIRWYGIMYVINFVLCYVFLKAQAKDIQPELDKQKILDLMFWTVIGVLLGARIFSTTIYDTTGYYLRRPWAIFWPFDENMRFIGLQGMSYHGGLFGAGVGLYLYYRFRARMYSFLDLCDITTIAFPLGYTFGRLGNFINGELYGRISTAPFAMIFPHAEPLPISNPHVASYAEQLGMTANESGVVNLPRHPSQLYEAFLEGIVVWFVMWFIVRKHRPYPGYAVSLYAILYGSMRFLAEYFRQPDAGLDFVIQLGPKENPNWLLISPFNFTMGQLLSFGMILCGIALLIFIHLKHRRSLQEKLLSDTEVSSSEKNRQRRLRKKLGN